MFDQTWRAACCFALAAGVTLAQSPPKAAAVVNGVPITVEEVETELKQAPLALPVAEAGRRVRQMEALGLLIDKVLMRQFLEKNVGEVKSDEVNRRLAEFESALRRQDRKTSLDEFCDDTNQTPDQFRAGLAELMQWNVFVGRQLTETALEKYYNENRDFFDKVSVRASHITLRVPPSATADERERVRAELTRLRAEAVANPDAFADLAKKHSHGPDAKNGGDVGYFARKWSFEEPFARAAFALPVGGISDVVETEFAMHVIKVTDRKPGEPSDFAKAKEAVRAFCSEDLRQEVLAQQRKAAAEARAIRIELP